MDRNAGEEKNPTMKDIDYKTELAEGREFQDCREKKKKKR